MYLRKYYWRFLLLGTSFLLSCAEENTMHYYDAADLDKIVHSLFSSSALKNANAPSLTVPCRVHKDVHACCQRVRNELLPSMVEKWKCLFVAWHSGERKPYSMPKGEFRMLVANNVAKQIACNARAYSCTQGLSLQEGTKVGVHVFEMIKKHKQLVHLKPSSCERFFGDSLKNIIQLHRDNS